MTKAQVYQAINNAKEGLKLMNDLQTRTNLEAYRRSPYQKEPRTAWFSSQHIIIQGIPADILNEVCAELKINMVLDKSKDHMIADYKFSHTSVIRLRTPQMKAERVNVLFN